MSITNSGIRYDVIARDSASRTFRTVGDSASRLERGMGRLARSVARTGAVLGGALAVGLAVSAKKAVTFESTMKRIQTQAGATAGDVGVLSKQVLALGKTTQQGPQALAESLYHLKSVGMDNVDAMKALKVSSDLAAVGGADLESTTNALAGAWRTGIKGATSFGQAASTVNAIIGAGNMTMDQFVAALGTGILPSAKTFGLSLSQVGAALALFTDEGVDSASAATRLRMGITLLGSHTPAANKQLARLGLSGLKLGETMRGPGGLVAAVSLLRDRLDKSGLSATASADLLSKAFGGGKSSSSILSMVNNVDVLRQKQDQVNRSMGKFPAAVDAQRKTAQAQIHLIESNLEVFSIKAGNFLLPPLTSFVTYINRTAIPATGKFSRSLLDMVPVEKIKAGFSETTGLIGDFFRGLSPKKPPVIKLPTPTVKAPSTPIPNTLKAPDLIVPSPTVKVGTTRIPDTLKAAVPPKSAARRLGEQVRGLISGGIGDAVKGIKWGDLGRTIGSGLTTAIGWVGKHTADLTKKFGSVLAKVDWVGVGKTLGSTAIPLAIGIVNSLFSPLFSLSFWEHHWLDTILAVLSVIPIGRVAGPLGKAFEKIPFLKIFSPLLKGVGGLGKLIESPVGKILGGVGRLIAAIGRGFLAGFERVFPGIGAAVGTKLDDLALAIFGYWARFGAAGGRLIDGLKSGIIKTAEGLGSIIGRVIGWVVKPFATAGSWLAGRGRAVVSGLRGGIVTGAAKIGGWAGDHVVSPVKGAFSGAGSWLVGRGAAVVAGLKDGALSGASKIGGWFTGHVVSPVKSAFTGAKTWLSGTGGDIISGLVSGTWSWLKQAGHGFGSWASKIKDKIVSAIVDVFKIGSPSKVMMRYGGWIVAGLQHGMLSGKKVLHAAVKGLFHSPLEAAENLAKNGVTLPAKWAAKLLSAKAPQGADVPLSPGVASAQSYASGLVGQLWPKDAAAQMNALRSLWNAESGWRANAENMSSGAYGIPQALPASKMAAAGSDWRTNAATQVRWGLDYIRGRYGDPLTAWESWNAHKPHWYAAGGLARIGETAWVGERGPELMQVTGKGTRIFSNPDSMALAKGAGIQLPGYARGTVSLGAARQDVAAAQHRVTGLEQRIAALRHAEATARSKRQRKRDRLAIMAAEQELKAARTRVTAANRELSAAQAQAKRVQGIANTLQNGFLKTLETGSAAAIASAIKSLNTKLQSAGFGSMVAGNLRTSSRMQSLANRRSSIQGQISAAQSYASDQASSLGDFLSLSNIPSSSMSSMISRMQAKQATASSFASEVASLSKRGLDKSLLSQLADAGPGSQLAALFAKASASDIGRLDKLAKSQAKLTVSFGHTMADAMYDSGSQAGKGFLSGLKAQEKQLQAELNRLADGMVKSIEHRLGIHSPSTVTRDRIGKQFVMGAALGVRQHAPHAAQEAQRMADTMAAVRARSVPVRAGAAAASSGGEVHHHEHTHYEINARTADFTPQQLEVLQRRTEARQRVGRPR